MRAMDWAYIQHPAGPSLDALREVSPSFKQRGVDLLDRYGVRSDLVDGEWELVQVGGEGTLRRF